MGKRNRAPSKARKRVSGRRGSKVKSRRGLYVAESPRHDRAVFASRRFEKGDLIERCPVIVLSSKDHATLDDTDLYGYVFEWWGGVALAFGFGSFYNHSGDPSAEYELLEEDRVVAFRAVRDIEQDEEITISYAEHDDLWFEPVEV